MNKNLTIFAALLIISTVALKAADKVPVVVTSQWLKENLNKPDLVILHVSTVIRDFENGHIPGARFLWPGWLYVSNEKESNIPAEIGEMREVLERLGVSNESHVVLCGIYGNLIPVCRMFLTLEHIGLGGRISILEGGFEEWRNSGGEVSLKTGQVKKGRLKIAVQDNLVDADWVALNLANKDFVIIDARPKASYEGTTGNPRKGHIPGSLNIPATDLYDSKSYHFSPAGKIVDMFKSLPVPEGSRPVFYCGTGNSASINYVAAVIAGYKPLLFDGSMETWGSRFDLPIEKH